MNTQSKLDKYILDHIEPEDEVLTELDRETNLNVLHARMLSGHLQGQVLTMLSKMIQPKIILEIGTFTGYSAICLSKGLQKDGKLITIEIDDELEFVRKYLEIEKLRFREKFNFRVDVEEGLGSHPLPKLCILTFVENAIKHGLRHKTDHRLLEIVANTEGKRLIILVRDNGVGREVAAGLSDQGTGKGIEMMREYLGLFSEATGRQAHFRISDLHECTQVSIEIQ